MSTGSDTEEDLLPSVSTRELCPGNFHNLSCAWEQGVQGVQLGERQMQSSLRFGFGVDFF